MMHSFSVKSNLKAIQPIRYTFANNECETGKWLIALRSLSYEVKNNDISEFANLSINLVRDGRMINNVRQLYNPPIAIWHLKGVSDSKHHCDFNLLWFECNFPDYKLEIFLSNLSENLLDFDCEISFNFLMKRYH